MNMNILNRIVLLGILCVNCISSAMDTNQPQEELDRKLILAVIRGQLNEVEECLDSGANVHATIDRFEMTPLHWAVFCGYQGVVELLLNHKASVNQKDNRGFTPLDVTGLIQNTYAWSEDIVNLLESYNTPVNVYDSYCRIKDFPKFMKNLTKD